VSEEVSEEKCPDTVPEWHKRNLVTLSRTETEGHDVLCTRYRAAEVGHRVQSIVLSFVTKKLVIMVSGNGRDLIAMLVYDEPKSCN